MSITLLIILITCGISYLALKNAALMNKLWLWPVRMTNGKELHRLITSGFVHADYMHLGFNMLTLYFFGEALESYFTVSFGVPTGIILFLALYLLGIIVSDLPSWIKKREDPNYRSLGASGGVSSILFAYIYLAPWSKIYLFFAIGIPSILFALFYVGYSIYMGKSNKGRINHDAHLWGGIFGFVYMILIDPSHGGIFIDALMQPFQ